MTIERFIEARIATMEHIARDASDGPWEIVDRGADVKITDAHGQTVMAGDQFHWPAFEYLGDAPDVRHIIRNEPARTLLLCIGLRGILGSHGDRDGACWACSTDFGPEPMPCSELRILAAIWSYHADYQQEWRVAD